MIKSLDHREASNACTNNSVTLVCTFVPLFYRKIEFVHLIRWIRSIVSDKRENRLKGLFWWRVLNSKVRFSCNCDRVSRSSILSPLWEKDWTSASSCTFVFVILFCPFSLMAMETSVIGSSSAKPVLPPLVLCRIWLIEIEVVHFTLM